MISQFVNREEELSILEKHWEQGGAHLIVLYGRRRIGKTRLISEFTSDKSGIFYFANETSTQIQIDQLKRKISTYYDDALLESLAINTWDQLFEYLVQNIRQERFYLWIDEFSFLVKNKNNITGTLQKFWDLHFSKSQIFVILTGSLLGMMSKKVLSSSSPLYGRRSRDLLIKQLRFKDCLEFTDFPFEDALKTHMVIGGVPEYLNKASIYKSFENFLQAEFFNQYGYFYREPYFIISQEFREIKTYFSIINAVASGNTQPSKIANFVGIKSREIYPYMDNLQRLGFITKEEPIIGNPRKSFYIIEDRIFDFWFNFVFSQREAIERTTFQSDQIDFLPFFGKRFEQFVRQEFLPLVAEFPEKLGRWWSKNQEIDIVAHDENTLNIYFVECKWSELSLQEAESELSKLEFKSKSVSWNNTERNPHYCLVAKNIGGKKQLISQGYVILDLVDIKKYISEKHSK